MKIERSKYKEAIKNIMESKLKIGVFLLFLMLMINFGSAWTSSEFIRDEIKSLDKLTNFGTYEIKESAWYDPLKIFTEETIKSIELKTNTEQCIDCLSEGTIVLNKDGTLIDDLIWKRSFDDGKTFVDWKGYTNWKLLVEEDVDVFETQCIDLKSVYDEKNDTYYTPQECSQVKTGTTKQWNVLDFKKEYKAGTYNYKIEGSKKASVTYDWIIKTNGQLLENWAVWGAVIGVGGVEANITINSPTNNSIQYTRLVTTNATANISIGAGAYLTNTSLNLSVNGGAWEIKNTTSYPAGGTFGHGQTLGGTGTSTEDFGERIVMLQDVYLSSVNLGTAITGTKVYVRTSITTGNIATGTITGTVATFSTPVLLTAGNTYYIMASKDGASYNFNYKDSGVSYNYSNTMFKFTGSAETTSGGIITTTKIFSILNMTFDTYTNQTQTFTNTFNAGDVVDFNYLFGDSDGDVGKSETRRFTIDGTAPTINLSYPTSLINYGKLNGTLQLNFTATDTNLDDCWYNYNGTNITTNCNMNTSQLKTSWNTTEGTVGSWTGYGYVKTLGTNIFNTINYTHIDLYSAGNAGYGVIEYSYYDADSANVTTAVYYSGYTEFNFTNPKPYNLVKDIKLFVSRYDGASSYKYNNSYYVYGGNQAITLSSKKNVTIYANDTAGNLNTTTFSWDYKVFQTAEYFVASTISGATNPFNITFESDSQITVAYLNYNGTDYLGSISSTGNTYTLTRTNVAPSVASATNLSFYWDITRADAFTYETATQNQTVSPIVINETCGAGMYVIKNLTMLDEITQAQIKGTSHNSSIKVDMDLYSSTRNQQLSSFSHEFNNTNPASFCIDNNLSGGEVYRLDIQIQYSAINYSTELYHLYNDTLSSSTLHENISLYDLPTANAQSFSIKARDTSYLPLEGALIQIERKYIDEGVFKITEIPKTDAKGITSASLELEDVIYNIYVYDEGILISSFTNVIAICQTPLVSKCEIELNAFENDLNISDWNVGDDFNLTLGYNSTSRVVIATFNIPSGEPAEVKLEVIRQDTLGTVVNYTTLTSASGTLTVAIPNSFGNSSVMAKVYKNDIEQGRGAIKIDQNSKEIFGVIQIFLAILVMMTLIGVAISGNPIITAVFLFVGVLLVFGMNLVENTGFIGATATILFFFIAIVLIMIKAARRT